MTKAGRWCFWPFVILVFMALISLDLQAYIIVLYLVALASLALLVSLCFPLHAKLQIRHAGRVCTGEVLPVEIIIEEQSGHTPGIDLQIIPFRLPRGIGAVPPEGVAVPALLSSEHVMIRLGLCMPSVEEFMRSMGSALCLISPLVLFNAYQYHAHPRSLCVYPRFTPLQQMSLPESGRQCPGGVALISQLGDSFELLGNREYQEGDNIRDIDWRATARLQTVILREYTQEHLLRVGVVLDSYVPTLGQIQAEEDFERAVSLCAAVSDYMARQEYLVDIFAAGPYLYHLTVGQSLTYLEEILDILACVEAVHKEPFDSLEPEIGQALGKIALVICILLDWTPSRQTFVHNLLAHGVIVKVIIVRDVACTLDPKSSRGVDDIHVVNREEFDAGVGVL